MKIFSTLQLAIFMVILGTISTYVSALKVALRGNTFTYPTSKKRWQSNKKIQTRSVDNNLLYTEYYVMAPLEIGTPPQKVLVSLDTGSADLLLYGEDYRKQLYGDEDFAPPFNSSMSSTYTSNGITYEAFFVDDFANVTANVSAETITFEGLTLKNQPLGLMMSGDWYPGPFAIGLMGLGFEYTSNVNVTPVMQQLVFSKAFTEPLFTFALTRPSFLSATSTDESTSEEGGIFTIGEIDQEQYKGNIGWSPLISTIPGSDAPSEWAFKLDNITVNGITLPEFEGLVAIFNTGIPDTLVSNALFNTIFAQVQDSFLELDDEGDPNNPQDYYVYIPCGEDLVPTFNLTISMGGVSVPIDSRDLIVRSPLYHINGKEFCAPRFDSMNNTNVSLILGQYIFFSLFAVFSFDPPRIGIAEQSDVVHNKGNQSNAYQTFDFFTTSRTIRPTSANYTQKALSTVPASATTHFQQIDSFTFSAGGSFAGGTLSMASVTPSTILPTSSNGVVPAFTQSTDSLGHLLTIFAHLTVILLTVMLIL
ncbi:acid protease [Meira miltonrushii]|uniref:Acid protease n=1 Tax=Meira miltonrushii TaxID=1280837 RepID=A0A316V6Q1_9BASI|nr:acid protease [Meira miltonrushii]PWN33267.1 acid protease [Meira miltonrushii]